MITSNLYEGGLMKRIYPIILCLFLTALLISSPLHCKVTEQSLQNEAGFMTIEPITFYFHYGDHFSRLQLKSSEARIWYSFHAADKKSAEKPLFVFFNGGPGSATCSGLMSMYTSEFSLDNEIETGGGDIFVPNPYSWTQLGNLLYIDAREAGFSYNLMSQDKNVQDEGLRFREFNAQNFNPFFDAADFVRVLLRFLASHPDLQNNPVVIVGESYGGVRTTCLLHLFLNYTEYGNGAQMYQDEALVDEIQAHFDVVFPDYQGQIVPPETITKQFGHQILIQPAISYGYQTQITDEMILQPGGLIDQFEQETGIPYDPDIHQDPLYYTRDVADRDCYIYTKPAGWLNGFFNNAAKLLRFTQNLSLMTGMDVTAIPQLYASARNQAYRVISTNYPYNTLLAPAVAAPMIKLHFIEPAIQEAHQANQEPGNMDAVFGTLRPWDRYYISSNGNANWAFHVYNVAIVRGYEVTISEPRLGRMFLQNVSHVHTFITDAALDLVVYSAAIPPSLARHDDIVESVQHIIQPTNGEVRPGYIVLNYHPSAFPNTQNLDTRTIRFPLYASSCHAVSLTQPEELLNDVSAWLTQKGIDLKARER
jgi:hypothetical protein